jgi:hypothetical protein
MYLQRLLLEAHPRVDTFCRLFRASTIFPGQTTDSALAPVMRQKMNGCVYATNELSEKMREASE